MYWPIFVWAIYWEYVPPPDNGNWIPLIGSVDDNKIWTVSGRQVEPSPLHTPQLSSEPKQSSTSSHIPSLSASFVTTEFPEHDSHLAIFGTKQEPSSAVASGS